MKYIVIAIAILFFSTPAFAGKVQEMVKAEAIRQGVPVGLALAIAKAESNFNCGAVGQQGERGVMQIKPSTARGIGYKGPASGLNNCQTGIRYGMIYLRMAYKLSGGNHYRTALLYNAGLGSKRKKSAYAEKITRGYVSSGHNRTNTKR